jgi:hypothetical protein
MERTNEYGECRLPADFVVRYADGSRRARKHGEERQVTHQSGDGDSDPAPPARDR